MSVDDNAAYERLRVTLDTYCEWLNAWVYEWSLRGPQLHSEYGRTMFHTHKLAGYEDGWYSVHVWKVWVDDEEEHGPHTLTGYFKPGGGLWHLVHTHNTDLKLVRHEGALVNLPERS